MKKKWVIITIVVIVVLLLAYALIHRIAVKQATKTVTQINSSIVQGNSKIIKNITFGGIDISPWGYFTGNYGIENVTVTPTSKNDNPITIEQIRVSNAKIASKGGLQSLKLLFQGIQMKDWKKLVISQTPKAGQKSVETHIKNINPASDLVVNYSAANKSLQVAVDLFNNDKEVLWSNNQFTNFYINAPVTNLNQWQPAAGKALEKATLSKSNYKLHFNINMNAKELMTAMPMGAGLLGSLGYHGLGMTIEGKGNFTNKTNIADNAFAVSMVGGGTITYHSVSKRMKALTLGDLINEMALFVSNPKDGLADEKNMERDYSLQLATLSIHDAGWLTHANQYFQNAAGKSAAQMASPYLAFLSGQEDWLIETRAAIDTFLKTPGGTVEFGIKPTQPFYRDQISSFFEKFQQTKNKGTMLEAKSFQEAMKNPTKAKDSTSAVAIQIAKQRAQAKQYNQQAQTLLDNFMKEVNYHATQY